MDRTTGVLNYPGNVETVVGLAFPGTFFKKDGTIERVVWVATGATYDPETNKTRVEMDRL